MLKKTSDDAKKRIVFFIDFSSIFREKSTENRAKSAETSSVHKNRRKSTFGTPIFSKKSIFREFLGYPWVARGLPGRPGNVPKSLIFSHSSFIVPENERGRPPGGLRKAPGVSPGVPRVSFCVDFWMDFAYQKQKIINKKMKKPRKILKNSKQP